MDVQKIVQSLLPIIINVIGGVMKSGGSGFWGKLREGGALATALSGAADQFKGNNLMEGLLGALTGDEGKNLLSNLDLEKLDLGNVMNMVGGLDNVLGDAGDEAEPVKGFIFDVAEKMAGAAGSGVFGTGQKINAGEQSFLDDLKKQLGL
ncbi:MAG: hypothetical protein KC547_16955 [Anaerolineae bacterium]|nr:hypothetical protein [Anaerolineae bacterium]